MAEIKREPVVIRVGQEEYQAFDENHTLSDIIRYAASCADLEEIKSLVDLMVKEKGNA